MCVSPAILIIDSREEEEEDKTTYIHDGVSCCCSILFSLFIFMLDFEMSKSEHCAVPSFNFIRRPVFSSIKDSSPAEKYCQGNTFCTFEINTHRFRIRNRP